MSKYEQVDKILNDFYRDKSNLINRFQYGYGATDADFKQVKDETFKKLETVFQGDK